jgi:hypothetical protein
MAIVVGDCCEISGDKIAVCEKTAGLRIGNFSDLNSACSKVLVPVKIFQFQDMGNESERYRDAANGLIIKVKCCYTYAVNLTEKPFFVTSIAI